MRIYGFEVEYAAVFLAAQGHNPLDPDGVAKAMFSRVRKWGGTNDIFLPNGGRIYIDTGAHPEYATPECQDIYDLVAHEAAGDLIMRDLARKAEDELRARGWAGKLVVLRNNADEHGNSWGCHENLQMRRAVNMEKLVEAFALYMATRPVWAGAGGLVRDGLGRYHFALSPRIQYIEEVSGISTSSSRPLVNLRDESHAGPDYRRLHLLAGDTNMSQVVNYVKMGVSGGILEMLERGRQLPDPGIGNPVDLLHSIERDVDFRRAFPSRSGRTYTALEIQQMFCEALEKEERRVGFPDDISRAVRMWRAILDMLERRDWEAAATRVDWVRKRFLLDAVQRVTGAMSFADPKVRFADFIYHAVDYQFEIYSKLNRYLPAITLVDRARIKDAVNNPPKGRPTLRGAFVKEALRSNKPALIDWERWAYEGDDDMWEVLDPTSETLPRPVPKTEALWETPSQVRRLATPAQVT